MTRHDQPYIGQYYDREGRPRERILSVQEYMQEERENMIYVIWSHEHRAWWGPNNRGYVQSIQHAGRYSAEEAAIPVLNDVLHNEIAIPFPNAVKFGPPRFHPYDGDQKPQPMENQHGGERSAGT